MYNAPFLFSEAPFKTTPDPRFYYSNQTFKNAWATLRFGVEARKGLMVITGEPGTGKTTLLRKALYAFNSKIKAAYVSDALVDGNDLLRPIITDLALWDSKEDRSAMIKRLNAYLLEQFEQGCIVALMIDEAQKMSLEAIEELRCLGNLETEKDKLLQIILAGQPELEQKFDQPELRQLRQRIVLRCRLEPIAHDEVQAYMDSRLCVVGYRSEDLFEPNAIEKIASFSSGIPRLINIICDNALLAAYSRSAQKVSDPIIDIVAENLRLGRSGQDDRLQTHTYPFGRNTPPSAGRREQDGVLKQHAPSVSSHLNAIARWLVTRTGISAAVALLSAVVGFLYLHDLRLSVSGARTGFAREGKTEAAHGTEIAIGKPASKIPNVTAPNKTERLIHGSQQTAPGKAKDLFVIEDSFVRAQPSPNAKIIATLTPGMRIQVTGPTGAYYRVRLRGTKTIRGYVHKEDAFFEPKKSETR